MSVAAAAAADVAVETGDRMNRDGGRTFPQSRPTDNVR